MNRTIVHFEIPANDPPKLASFYSGLFDWKIEKDPGMDYWLIRTGDGEAGPNGGMMARMEGWQCPLNYIGVESVDDFSKKVTSLGGKVMMDKRPVPKMGWFAICEDPDGNPFALWQPDTNAA